MSDLATTSSFYPPDQKELGLGVCHILSQAGGQLTLERVEELLADILQIPNDARNQVRAGYRLRGTEWQYYVAWACTNLRNHGFLARNSRETRGMCTLSDHGFELGRFASAIYTGDNPALPDWVGAYLEPLFKRTTRFLAGTKQRRPPDYELCRWVRYCYLLQRADLGVKVFSLILPDHVEPSLYQQAERQARIMRLRLEDHPDGRQPAPDATQANAKGGAANALRRWVDETFEPGCRIPTLVRNGHNEVRAVSKEGIVVISSRTGRENLVPWAPIEAAYEKLLANPYMYIDHHQIQGRGSFICSLLAQLPDAEPVPGECAVVIVDPMTPTDAMTEDQANAQLAAGAITPQAFLEWFARRLAIMNRLLKRLHER